MKQLRKRLLAITLSVAMLLPSVLTVGATAPAPTVWDRVIAHPTAEQNDGDMNMIPFNNPTAIMDLEAGTWAQPAVLDYDGDGILDLIVSGTGVPYSVTMVFYGDEDSKDTLLMSKGDKVHWGVGNFYPSYFYKEEKRSDTDGNQYYEYYDYTYEGTMIFSGSTGYSGFSAATGPYASGKNYNSGISWPKESTRANEFSLVDFDGDGDKDLIRGVGNWNEYGWAGKYDATGHWGSAETNDPLHGWVMWAENKGNDQNPDFSGTANLLCVNNDSNTPIDTYGHPAPSFYDWDNDGDLDLMCGNFVDDILYFENIGTRTEPCYAEGVPPEHSNGDYIQLELCMLTCTTFDWNQDGLPDLLVGEEDGRICYYENTGDFADSNAPVFEAPRYFKTPADNLAVGILCTPVSIDWDGDGDEDLFAGDSAGFFSYMENVTPADGDRTNPSWAPPVRLTDYATGEVLRIIAGPNGSIQGPAEEKWGYTVMSMGDWDGDGDADIIANSIWGKIVWIENLNNNGENNTQLKFSAIQMVEVDDETPDKPSWNWWDPEPYELVSQWRTTPLHDRPACGYRR